MGASGPNAVGNSSLCASKRRTVLAVKPLYAGVCACLGFSAYGQQQSVEAGAAPLEEVLVTGSRIVRRDLDAPSPILTVDSEAFDQTSNIAIESTLNQYPQFNPGATQFNASNVTPNSADTPGVSTLNMRGLGDGRGLVLVDGRRVQPVNAALAIDTNMIPSAMIASVEVISGGAAATYGSDALAGVVNFKLRRDFEGVRMTYQQGFQEAGDGEEARADILIGGNFGDDRGNAVFNAAWAAARRRTTRIATSTCAAIWIPARRATIRVSASRPSPPTSARTSRRARRWTRRSRSCRRGQFPEIRSST